MPVGVAPDLPDAPSSLHAAAQDTASGPLQAKEMSVPEPLWAPRFATTIKSGYRAEPLDVRTKVEMGFRRPVSWGGGASLMLSAGWGHLNNNRPHFGTDSAAFGQRVGAAALRRMSQSVFYYGGYSAIFHTDPRYYVMGPAEPFKKRAWYAAKQVVVTRSDKGRTVPNLALFAAVLSSQMLTNTYYPAVDQDVPRTLRSTGSSLAFRVLSQELREFSGDIRRIVRRHKP